MAEPTEIVTAIFIMSVGIVVGAMILGTIQGWNVLAISQYVSNYAVPFVLALIVFFIILQISQKAL